MIYKDILIYMQRQQYKPSHNQSKYQQDKILLQVGYEVKSHLMGSQIFKNVTNDFVLPAWMQRYFQKIGQGKNDNMPKKPNQKRYKCQIIDYRMVKFEQNKLELLGEDKHYFEKLRLVSKNKLLGFLKEHLGLIQSQKIKITTQKFEVLKSNCSKQTQSTNACSILKGQQEEKVQIYKQIHSLIQKRSSEKQINISKGTKSLTIFKDEQDILENLKSNGNRVAEDTKRLKILAKLQENQKMIKIQIQRLQASQFSQPQSKGLILETNQNLRKLYDMQLKEKTEIYQNKYRMVKFEQNKLELLGEDKHYFEKLRLVSKNKLLGFLKEHLGLIQSQKIKITTQKFEVLKSNCSKQTQSTNACSILKGQQEEKVQIYKQIHSLIQKRSSEKQINISKGTKSLTIFKDEQDILENLKSNGNRVAEDTKRLKILAKLQENQKMIKIQIQRLQASQFSQPQSKGLILETNQNLRKLYDMQLKEKTEIYQNKYRMVKFEQNKLELLGEDKHYFEKLRLVSKNKLLGFLKEHLGLIQSQKIKITTQKFEVLKSNCSKQTQSTNACSILKGQQEEKVQIYKQIHSLIQKRSSEKQINISKGTKSLTIFKDEQDILENLKSNGNRVAEDTKRLKILAKLQENQKMIKIQIQRLQASQFSQPQSKGLILETNQNLRKLYDMQLKEKTEIYQNKRQIFLENFYDFDQELQYVIAWEQGLELLNNILYFKKEELKSDGRSYLSQLRQKFQNQKFQKCIKIILFQQHQQFSFLIRFQGTTQKVIQRKQSQTNFKHKTRKNYQENYQETDFIMKIKSILKQKQEVNNNLRGLKPHSNKQIIQVKKINVKFISKLLQFSDQGFIEINDISQQDTKKINLITIDIEERGYYKQYFSFAKKKERPFMQYKANQDKINQIKYFFKEFKFRNNKKNKKKHYNLAFQGGGAKGLAYIGVYKAMKQNKIKSSSNYGRQTGKEVQQIKIKNIMGSSAGGIIAIAASTGIPYRQIQELCFKMGDITKRDRIDSNYTAYDEYGNIICFQKIEEKMKQLLKELGFLNQETFECLSAMIKQKSQQIEEDLIKYLKIVSPTIADIFEDTKQATKQQGWLWWKKTVKTQEKKPKLNWSGVLLHGALMKGQAIHDIAAQCLVKFFIKKSFKPRFQKVLEDLHYKDCEKQKKRINHERIIQLLTQYKEYQKLILSVCLAEFLQEHFSNQRKQFNQFMICVINKAMILLNQFLEQKTSLRLGVINLFEHFQYSNQFIQQTNLLLQIITRLKDKYQGKFQVQHSSIRSQIKQLIIEQNLFYDKLQVLQRYIKQGKYQNLSEKDTLSYYFKVMFIYKLIKDPKKSKDNKQFKYSQQKIANLNCFYSVLQCQTYNQINSHTNMVNLLEHRHFSRIKNESFTIQSYLIKIFHECSQDTIFLISNVGSSNFFMEKMQKLNYLSLINEPIQQKRRIKKQHKYQKEQKFKKINILFELCDYIYSYLGQNHKIVMSKRKIDLHLMREVSIITMKQYYFLNPIEITFTAVDMDNKILRLFNHKTTPNLPICKAVQMTGSFPIAFKALRWQRQWGNYYVYHEDEKVVIDLKGHEFTDGGLLANFPIKYFDNQTIRKCYFSHAHQKYQSIMLGFGLDQIKEGQYIKVQQIVQENNRKKIQQQFALKNVLNHFTSWFKIKEGMKIFLKSRWFNFGEKVGYWGDINKNLINQIPILRFITKILSAYPNADRNLSLQAFTQEIMAQTTSNLSMININEYIILNAKTPQERQIIKKEQWNWNIKNFFNQYQIFKKSIKKVPSKKAKESIQFYDNNEKNKWKQIIYLINKEKSRQRQKVECLRNGYRLLFENKLKKPLEQTQLALNGQRQMSLYLIKIFFVTLKNGTNEMIKKHLSYRYIYYSFLFETENINFQQNHQFSAQNIKFIHQQMNRKNLQNFLFSRNFQGIQKRLNFWDFKKKYLEKVEELKINFSEHPKNYQNIQNKLVQEALRKNKANFVDFLLFDITESMRKMIKFLYLQIKLKKLMGKQGVSEYLKDSEFHTTFKQHIVKNYNKIYLLKDYNNYCYYQLITPSDDASIPKDYLTFDEILNFMCEFKDEGLEIDDKRCCIKYHWSFQQYLWNLKNTKNQFQQKILFSFDMYANNIEQRSFQRLNQYLSKTSQTDKRNKLQLQRYNYVEKIIDSKYNQVCSDFLSQPRIDIIAIQKLEYNKQTIQCLQAILKKEDEVKDYTQFLMKQFQFKYLDSMSIESERKIRSLRYQTKRSLKNLIFGQNLQNQNILNQQVKIMKRQIKQLRNAFYLTNSNLNNQIQVKYSKLQSELLKYFYLRTVKDYISNKYAGVQEKKQFNIFHNAYIKDLDYFFCFLMKLILLLINYQQPINKKTSKDLKKIKFSLPINQIIQNFNLISAQFINKYEKLLYLPQNLINLQILNEIFLIKYVHLSSIINSISSIIKAAPQKQDTKMQNILQTVQKFNNFKCCLPLFSQDWQQLVKINENFSNVLQSDTKSRQFNEQILSLCVSNARNNYILSKTKKKILQQNEQKQQNHNYRYQIQEGSASKIEEVMQEETVQKNALDTHLILEGVQDASAFCAYYHQIQKSRLLNNEMPQKNNFKIGMITSKLFGFLVCMGQDIDQIRLDLYKTRNYLFEMFDSQRLGQPSRQQSPCISLSYSLKDNFKLQLFNIFRILNKEYQQQKGKVDYLAKFNNIKLLVQQQQHYYIETCNKILDQATRQIENIEKSFLDSQKANQIAKLFGYDYICQFNQRHKYSKYSIQCKQTYHQIFAEFYEQFGSIISSIICSLVTQAIPFSIDESQTKNFTKKFMMARLMTVFKLKAFIFSKLQQHGFPYGITLDQFYKRCNNPILLNFVVVNLTEQRLDFLNKTTSPNMPVWAAIIAASTLPCLHRSFQSQKNWQDLQGEQFKTNQMLDFFQHSQNFKRKYTFYNSSMYISSIPMELLSNNTFFNRYEQLSYKEVEGLKKLHRLGFAFNKTYATNLQHMKVEKKYLNLSIKMVWLLLKMAFSYKQLIVTNKNKKNQDRQHFNRSYQVKYSPAEQIKDLLLNNNINAMTLSTIIGSNDNLIMKWYSDKLIRLPIKISTLDFDKTIQDKVFKKFKIKIPSYDAKEALIRSEQITKTFIHNIQNRFKYDKKKYFKIHSESEAQRFLVKIQAQIIDTPNKHSNFTQKYCKVTFLNYSKWNQNMYSNFIIQYMIKNLKDKQRQLQRCENSQIVWRIEQGSQLLIRFYYLHYHTYQENALTEDYISSKNSKIRFSEYAIDFRNIFKELPTQNSYDYSFIYAWNQQSENNEKNQIQKIIDMLMKRLADALQKNEVNQYLFNGKQQQQKIIIMFLKARKINNIAANNNQKHPLLMITNEQTSEIKRKYSQKYIQRSLYKLRRTQ